MASSQDGSRPTFVAIAPAVPGRSQDAHPAGVSQSAAPMPYTCQSCARRKVKCDKATPICSSCHKSGLPCLYQAPAVRVRKRGYVSEMFEKLRRYEHILQENGLLDATAPTLTPWGPSDQEVVSFHPNEIEEPSSTELIPSDESSTYIDSPLWRELHKQGCEKLGQEEEDESNAVEDFRRGTSIPDPLTASLMTFQSELAQYHPAPEDALELWRIYSENVDPICRILHIPSATEMVEAACQNIGGISRAKECLLFAIYHFAIFSLSSEGCEMKFQQSRAALLKRFHSASLRALANASFLRSTDIVILQALVLFLIPCRHNYDAQTYWILTGVAVRIGQRLGLQRNGDKLGLSPFDVQMRRRLFYQLLPLDGQASQMSGVRLPVIPADWDTKLPLNINDDQIWPGMLQTPEERAGPTGMMFYLLRAMVGSFLTKTQKSVSGTRPLQYQAHSEAEAAIQTFETEVEQRFIRYCDIVNPLHFLTMASARSGIAFMRFRLALAKVKKDNGSEADHVKVLALAQKIIDTDNAACTHSSLQIFRWYTHPFFLWGTWESLIALLNGLRRKGSVLSGADREAAWGRLEQVYRNHDEILGSGQALYAAFRQLTLSTWDEQTPKTPTPMGHPAVPAFIQNLRSQQMMNIRSVGNQSDLSDQVFDETTTGRSYPSCAGPVSQAEAGEFGAEAVAPILDFDPDDWLFWDELISAHSNKDPK